MRLHPMGFDEMEICSDSCKGFQLKTKAALHICAPTPHNNRLAKQYLKLSLSMHGTVMGCRQENYRLTEQNVEQATVFLTVYKTAKVTA